MKRRAFLATATLALSAGCISTGDGSGSSTPLQEIEQTSAPAPTPTPEPTTEAVVEQVEAEVRELPNRSQIGVRGRIENTGETWLNAVNATARFYNESDELLDTSIAGVRGMAPNESWELWAPYRGEGTVGSTSLDVTDAVGFNRVVDPDTVRVDSSDLEVPVDEGSPPLVTGTVRNTSDETIDYLLGVTKIYDGDGLLLGSGIDDVNQIRPGEQWRIDTQVHLRYMSWKDRVSDHSVLVAE